MARPSVWRWEFQHVEKEYMTLKKKAGRSPGPHSAVRIGTASHIGVTGAQHGGKAGRFHFAALALAGLFKMTVIAHFLQSPFTIDLFLQSPQGFIDGLAFFQSNFCQKFSLPLSGYGESS
jgi:hypothetical protein